MDENSCENETEESVDDKEKKKAKTDPHVQEFTAKVSLTGKPTRSQLSNRHESTVDAQGPSTNFYPLILKQSGALQAISDGTDSEEIVEAGELEGVEETEQNVQYSATSAPKTRLEGQESVARIEEVEKKVQQLPGPAAKPEQKVQQLPGPAIKTEQNVQQLPGPATKTEQNVQQLPGPATKTEQKVQQTLGPAKKTEQRVQQLPGPAKKTEPQVQQLAGPVDATEPKVQQSSQAPEESGRAAPAPAPSSVPAQVPVQEQVGLSRETGTLMPSAHNLREALIQTAPIVSEELSVKSVGPPPSYSFVMKQKKRLKHVPSPDTMLSNRSPPPNYAGTRGLYITSQERTFGFPSFAEPIWRSHSQPALCPRCGIIVLTTAHSHESIATHVAALALCLFGCWPCCLLPYCMNVCKNTYHYCPICQAFLGLYTPW